MMEINNSLAPQIPMMGKSTKPPEDSGDFIQELAPKKGSYFHEDTIFTTQNGAPSDYTVYQTGKFPDSSFFEEKFQGLLSGSSNQQVGGIEGCGDVEGEYIIAGYFTEDYQVYYEYAPDSTPENPIMNVRIEFHETKEAWEGTVNLNDIDPQKASHMEMSLLSAHLTGEPFPTPGLSLGADTPFSKVNFFDIFREALDYAENLNQMYRDSYLLDLYKEHFKLFENFSLERQEEAKQAQQDEKSRLTTQLEQDQVLKELMLRSDLNQAMNTEVLSRSALVGA